MYRNLYIFYWIVRDFAIFLLCNHIQGTFAYCESFIFLLFFRIRSSQIAIPYKFCILFSPFPNYNPDPASFPYLIPTLLFIVHIPEKKDC